MGNVQYILKLQKANNYTILLQTSAATAQSFHITNIDCLSSASLSRGTSAYSSAGITHLAGSLLLSQPHLAGSLLLCQHLLPGSLLLRQHLLPGDFSSASFSCWTSASLSRRTLARLSRVTTAGLQQGYLHQLLLLDLNLHTMLGFHLLSLETFLAHPAVPTVASSLMLSSTRLCQPYLLGRLLICQPLLPGCLLLSQPLQVHLCRPLLVDLHQLLNLCQPLQVVLHKPLLLDLCHPPKVHLHVLLSRGTSTSLKINNSERLQVDLL